MMVSAGSSDYFTLDSLHADNSPTPLNYIKGSKSGLSNTLKDHYFVVYSGLNLKHYFIKKVSSAVECAANNCTGAGGNPVLPQLGKIYYEVTFNPIVSGSLYSFFPTLSNITSWQNQSNFFSFPTQSFSLTGSYPDLNPASNVQPHTITHFYTISSKARDLTIVPVEFIFFYLKKGAKVKNAQNVLVQSYDLIQRKYMTGDNFVETVLASSFVGTVYISRKIGTDTLNLILQK